MIPGVQSPQNQLQKVGESIKLQAGQFTRDHFSSPSSSNYEAGYHLSTTKRIACHPPTKHTPPTSPLSFSTVCSFPQIARHLLPPSPPPPCVPRNVCISSETIICGYKCVYIGLYINRHFPLYIYGQLHHTIITITSSSLCINYS